MQDALAKGAVWSRQRQIEVPPMSPADRVKPGFRPDIEGLRALTEESTP